MIVGVTRDLVVSGERAQAVANTENTVDHETCLQGQKRFAIFDVKSVKNVAVVSTSLEGFVIQTLILNLNFIPAIAQW